MQVDRYFLCHVITGILCTTKQDANNSQVYRWATISSLFVLFISHNKHARSGDLFPLRSRQTQMDQALDGPARLMVKEYSR